MVASGGGLEGEVHQYTLGNPPVLNSRNENSIVLSEASMASASKPLLAACMRARGERGGSSHQKKDKGRGLDVVA